MWCVVNAQKALGHSYKETRLQPYDKQTKTRLSDRKVLTSSFASSRPGTVAEAVPLRATMMYAVSASSCSTPSSPVAMMSIITCEMKSGCEQWLGNASEVSGGHSKESQTILQG